MEGQDRSLKSSLPTRKWIAIQLTAIAGLVTAWLSVGEWNSTLTIALVGLLTQAAVGYLVPNADTPGGVPVPQAVAAAAPARV
jgi:hypothetical protein